MFLRRTPISSQTNFASTKIGSISSVMLFVEICINNPFIFSISSSFFSLGILVKLM